MKFLTRNLICVFLCRGFFDGKCFYVDIATCNASSLIPPQIEDDSSPPSLHTALLGGSTDSQPLEILHICLGHLYERGIRHLLKKSTGMAIGPGISQTLNSQCEPYLRGAQHRQVSYLRGNPATALLQHVWVEVKGLLLDKDVLGFRYFVLFIDEKSRYTRVYPLLEKADAFSAYKLFEARVERLTNS